MIIRMIADLKIEARQWNTELYYEKLSEFRGTNFGFVLCSPEIKYLWPLIIRSLRVKK